VVLDKRKTGFEIGEVVAWRGSVVQDYVVLGVIRDREYANGWGYKVWFPVLRQLICYNVVQGHNLYSVDPMFCKCELRQLYFGLRDVLFSDRVSDEEKKLYREALYYVGDIESQDSF